MHCDDRKVQLQELRQNYLCRGEGPHRWLESWPILTSMGGKLMAEQQLLLIRYSRGSGIQAAVSVAAS